MSACSVHGPGRRHGQRASATVVGTNAVSGA